MVVVVVVVVVVIVVQHLGPVQNSLVIWFASVCMPQTNVVN